jgi:stage II sporulation protein D (peptidoglycan lytic transglycosylase)
MFKNISVKIIVCMCILTATLLYISDSTTGNSIPPVRVKIFNDATELHIEGRGIQLIDTYKNIYLFKNQGISYIIMSAGNNGIEINQKLYPVRIMTLLFTGGVVKINNRLLRGHLEIANIDNKHLIVINEINLESYVAGLVNAEMPHDWPTEALKAQAVVARTYALWQKERHLNEYYDMDSGMMDRGQ